MISAQSLPCCHTYLVGATSQAHCSVGTVRHLSLEQSL